ncbi:NADH dehydrogenase [ubiquinone] 1 beta subcomplex subunit 9-like [Mytilus trossulus]|uniref:NADH dehydrogenase [ubiquinone] 1 beta subcomplex subunit 9-like n=1 Tax=Mytilus trossulus TaxID=6551 RepID=UPI003006E407
MSFLQTELISHARQVKTLYKEALRQLESKYSEHITHGRLLYRYQAVCLRAEFDQNKDEKDIVKSRQLVKDGRTKMLADWHSVPLKFAHAPGGAAYDRVPVQPDALLDMWHPREKALYPDYFARRDIRKREFVERWVKKYGGGNATEQS